MNEVPFVVDRIMVGVIMSLLATICIVVVVVGITAVYLAVT